jgi:hypothetical protein
MIVVRIEHPVDDFEAWKTAFDHDPVGRARSGVRRYQVIRSLDGGDRVGIDLEFDDGPTAAAFRESLMSLWSTPGATGLGIGRPVVTVAEIVDRHEY